MSTKITSADPKAFAVPAHYVNRFQVAHFGGVFVRLSLAEAPGLGEEHYRAAVVMSAADARELALSILNLLGGTSATPS